MSLIMCNAIIVIAVHNCSFDSQNISSHLYIVSLFMSVILCNYTLGKRLITFIMGSIGSITLICLSIYLLCVHAQNVDIYTIISTSVY